MTTISYEAQAQTDSLTSIEKTSQADQVQIASTMPSQETSTLSQENFSDEAEAGMASGMTDDDAQGGLQRVFRMRFKNLTPLRKKTLELLRENPDLDGGTADRIAREALGLSAPQPSQPLKAKSREGTLRSKSSYVPAPGNFGTFTKNQFNKDSVLEKLQNMPLGDRKEALLAALSAAAQRSHRQ